MDPAGLPALEDAIRHLHGAAPRFVECIPVIEKLLGRVVWDGEVSVFDLTGHASASRCYAWSYAAEGTKRQFVAVLHAPHVESPSQAVRAYVVASARKADQTR
jgi:hypothetical protein